MLPKDKIKEIEYRKKLSEKARRRTGSLNSNFGNLKVEFTYDILYNLYIIQKKTINYISNLYDVCDATVFKYLKLFKIKTRKIGYEKASLATRHKMSIARKGRKESIITRRRKSKSLKEAYIEGRHSQWKGGVSDENSKDRMSLKYKIWREEVFKRDNYTCQNCLDRSCKGNSVYLEAHHIKSFANYKELRFNVNNGLTLCVDCHNETKKNNMKGNKNATRN